jgi:hypothetical protein
VVSQILRQTWSNRERTEERGSERKKQEKKAGGERYRLPRGERGRGERRTRDGEGRRKEHKVREASPGGVQVLRLRTKKPLIDLHEECAWEVDDAVVNGSNVFGS